MFNKFPVEVEKKRRIIIQSEQDLLNYINKNNTFNDVHITVYAFEETFERAGKLKCKHDTAILDKIFFDFDENNCWEDTNRLHMWCLNNHIKHCINFSGRGYHLYIFLKKCVIHNLKGCLANIHNYFITELILNLDQHIVGDLARFTRMPNTYNLKRKKWCISLTKTEFEKGDEYIRELAEKQSSINKPISIIGTKLFDPEPYDMEPPFKDGIELGEIDVEIDKDKLIKNEVPLCIKKLLNDLKSLKKSYRERYIIILYFKIKGYSRKEVICILQKYLTPQKFKSKNYECVVQTKHIFGRDDLIFPTCESLKKEGRCCSKTCGGMKLYI